MNNKKKLLLHARIETISNGHFWRDWQPCVIPIDGFVERDTKQDVREYHLFTGEDLWLGGLWKREESEQAKVVIATTAPNHCVATIHHRMPVCLRTEELQQWIFSFQQPSKAVELKATPIAL